jgi:hypothetical protein
MSEGAKNYLEKFEGAAWLENISNADLEKVAAAYWKSYWASFKADADRLNSLK